MKVRLPTHSRDIRDTLGLHEGPFTVHRLDKNTTGLLSLAPTTAQAKVLSKAYGHVHRSTETDNQPTKTYLALVHARSKEAMDNHSTMASTPARSADSREPQSAILVYKRLYIDENGYVSSYNPTPGSEKEKQPGKEKLAISTIERLAVSSRLPIALMRLQLHTGIKHQLRVTLSGIRAPILGDDRYGDEEAKTVLPVDVLPPNTLMLHSSSFEFRRYLHGSGFVNFKVSAPPPHAFLQACDIAGIRIAPEALTGGVWFNGKEMTDKLRLKPVLEDDSILSEQMAEEAGFWLVD